MRNKIYEFAFSGIIVSVFRSPESPKQVQLVPHAEGGGSYLSTASIGFNVTGLTEVCRQMYAESRLLLFKFVTFHVHSDGSFTHFLNTLNDVQQATIATIQMATQDANVGGTLWYFITYFPSNDLNYQKDHLDLLEWMDVLPFERLAGLKRVVVEEDGQWTYTVAGEQKLRGGIAHCLRGRDVEVVIPKTDAGA
jgi:hypothetical protein